MDHIEPTGAGREVAVLFNRESARYDEAHDLPIGHELRARLVVVVEAIGPGPGSVLDAGMGPGRLCAALERAGWTASGLDLSEHMVERARMKLPHARDRLVQGTLEALPFDHRSFDAVAATGVLEYLDKPRKGVEELVRVLRPGGVAVVSIPNPLSLRNFWRWRVAYPLARLMKRAIPGFSRPAPARKPPSIRVGTMKRMLADAGLEPGAVTYTSFLRSSRPLEAIGARRLALWLERVRPRFARPLASQIVLVATKPALPA